MTKTSVKKPFLVVVAVVILLILGVVSFTKMTTDLLPHMNLPYILVITPYPGASPEKVESDISQVMESALGTVTGVENVNSTSSENYSIVTLEFQDDMNMDSAMVKVSTAVNELELPERAGHPTLLELSPDLMATMYVSIDYEGMDIYELTDFCEDTVIPYFERQGGVASVDATGLVDKTVEIRFNKKKIDKINAQVLGIATDKLDDAQAELDDAKKELADAKKELNSKKEELNKKQDESTQELAEFSKMLDEAMATKASYEAQLVGLKASQTALKTEKKAYKDNKVKSNYDSINKMIASTREMLSSQETRNTAYTQVYDQVYEAMKVQALQGACAASNIPLQVTNENFATVLATMGMTEEQFKESLRPTITGLDAYKTAIAQADAAIDTQVNALPTDIKDAIDHPEKLQALKNLAESQGQAEAAKNLTKDNLKQLYNIVNTRMPQIETELANLEIEIKAAEAVVEQVKISIAEAEDNYTKVEQGKMTAAASFGAFQAQMASGEGQIESGEKQLEEAQDQLDDSRESALKSANMDSLLNQSTLSQIMSAQNFSMPAGYIEEGTDKYLVKVGDEYHSIKEIENNVLCNIDKIGDVTISDVADVVVTDNAEDSYAKMNQNEAVILSISKSSTAGTSEVSKTCGKAIETLLEQYPDMHITTVMDQGDYIKLIIDNVMSNLIWGAVLAIIVLALFLKDVRPTIVVAFSIPLSVLFAVVLMYFSNITLNIISLSGLALGVGMLVDNSIVVIENIYRLRNEGMSAPKAAVKGANQVAGAIFASTLTTVCVFLPIVFTTGLVKQIFADMGLTIAYSLLASLIVALTLVPSMSATVLKNTNEKEHKWFDIVLNGYEKILNFCLRVKVVPLSIAIILLVFCIWEATRVGMIFIPEMGGNQMSVTFTAPDELSDTEGFEMADACMEYIAGIDGVVTVGAMSGTASGGVSMLQSGSVKNFEFFIMTDEAANTDNKVVAKQIEKYFEGLEYEELEYNVSTSNMDFGSYLGSGLEINIYGDETDELLAISERVMNIVSDVEGFEDITNGQEEGSDEIRLIIDKNKAMKYNLTVAQIYSEISGALTTETASTTLRSDGEEYKIVIIDETEELSRDNLMDYTFEYTKNEDGKDVTEEHKLKEFASREDAKSLASITRENQSRFISVKATTAEGYNTTLLTRKIEDKLLNLDLPENYTLEIAGETETVVKAMKDLLLMILMAVAFIYLIMVAQFQSLLSPFIVLFTIPLAFTGGFLAMFITGEELSVVAMMGFLVLAGVVVNNGIVFVDYVNQLRIDGMERREALVATGRTRMRPILMTALTTILAMSTMAFSKNQAAAMGKGMSLVTIGGLVYATLMTLFIVPVLYDIMFKKEIKVVDVGEVE